MAWLEAHQSLRDHRKVLDLAERLAIPEPHVAGHLMYLWLWAIDNAPDGVLPESPRITERAAGWTGHPGVFVQCLQESGFADEGVNGRLHIHDWDEYAGKLMDRRESNAKRQKEWRERHRTATSPPHDAPVTVTSPSRNGATEHNSTEHNSTKTRSSSESAREARPAPQPDRPVKSIPKPKSTPVPDTWPLDTDRLEFAEKHGLSPPEAEHETTKFLDHFRANGKRMVDWAAAWRNWIARSAEFRPRPSPGHSRASPGSRNQMDRARESHERLAAKLAAAKAAADDPN